MEEINKKPIYFTYKMQYVLFYSKFENSANILVYPACNAHVLYYCVICDMSGYTLLLCHL